MSFLSILVMSKWYIALIYPLIFEVCSWTSMPLNDRKHQTTELTRVCLPNDYFWKEDENVLFFSRRRSLSYWICCPLFPIIPMIYCTYQFISIWTLFLNKYAKKWDQGLPITVSLFLYFHCHLPNTELSHVSSPSEHLHKENWPVSLSSRWWSLSAWFSSRWWSLSAWNTCSSIKIKIFSVLIPLDILILTKGIIIIFWKIIYSIFLMISSESFIR